MKMCFKPTGIENEHRITKDTDCDFLYLFQQAVLAALVEIGELTQMQYRQAEETLHRQWRYSGD